MDTKAIGKILGPRFDAVSEDGARALKELGLPLDAAILDVGVGNGNFAIYLASQGYRVLTGEPGTDKSHYAGKDWALNAKKVGVLDNIRFEAFDASKLPFESEAFDAVFFFGVLHHIEEKVRSEVFREALRVSKANGVVVFFEPRKEMLERLWVDDPGHPLAANPSNYLPGQRTREHRIEGSSMDIFIYKKAATPPSRETDATLTNYQRHRMLVR
jgi:SAM-dependent methyltransferase